MPARITPSLAMRRIPLVFLKCNHLSRIATVNFMDSTSIMLVREPVKSGIYLFTIFVAKADNFDINALVNTENTHSLRTSVKINSFIYVFSLNSLTGR